MQHDQYFFTQSKRTLSSRSNTPVQTTLGAHEPSMVGINMTFFLGTKFGLLPIHFKNLWQLCVTLFTILLHSSCHQIKSDSGQCMACYVSGQSEVCKGYLITLEVSKC